MPDDCRSMKLKAAQQQSYLFLTYLKSVIYIYIYIYIYEQETSVCVCVLHGENKQETQRLFDELSYSFNT